MNIHLQRKLKELNECNPIIKNITYDDEHGKYKIEDLLKSANFVKPIEFILNFTNSTYNYDIVTAYERNYIDNFENLS
jgi:hypothetical protein